MKTLVTSIILGVLVVWGFKNIPNFFGYLFVGLIVLLLIKEINKK